MGPKPTPLLFIHCEDRGSHGPELPPHPPSGTWSTTPRGYAHSRRAGPPLATLHPVTASAAWVLQVLRILSSPRSIAFCPSCHRLQVHPPPVPGGVVVILPDNSRHPSSLPPVKSVRQWWTLPPAVSGPRCRQMARNPGSFLVFNRIPVGKDSSRHLGRSFSTRPGPPGFSRRNGSQHSMPAGGC